MARRNRDVDQTELFDGLSQTWWDEAGALQGMGVLLAPVRVPFVTGVIRTELGQGGHRVLDLGAGGGLLAEDLDRAGLSVVALDPSLLSIGAGRDHSATSGSAVQYVGGRGEQLPFADTSFDAVVCMEVLEHVDSAPAVVAEAGRVLRQGGIFIFSGPNRTLTNRVGLIFIAQDLLGVVPRGTHKWSRLVRPDEMNRHMRAAGIEPILTVGLGLKMRDSPKAALAVLGLLVGHLTYPDAARLIYLATGTGTRIAYQGVGRRQ
jgi:2-polyprenyl-6-hydroxyphenyl methylase/3-demethylubiquinone-9 3-methyltransferase